MPDITYIAFGAGVQSTAMLVMSALGDHGVAKADVAIFADTGDEPAWVYEAVERMREWAAPHGIPVVTVSVGCLSAHVIGRCNGTRNRAPAIPAYTTNEDGKPSRLQRHCSTDYKVVPINRYVRSVIGRKKSAHATGMLGISLDEARRMKDSRDSWITLTYPLIDARLTRADCIKYMDGKGLPKPVKSACRFCPFHDDNYWRSLKEDAPHEFELAAQVDDQIRSMQTSGIPRPVFLHKSLKPLREVVFNDDTPALFPDLECEGMCNV